MTNKSLKYTDGDIFAFEHFGDFLKPVCDDESRWKVQQLSSMNMVMLVVCCSGNVRLRINGKDFEVTANNGLALLPTAVIEKLQVSGDVHIRGLGIAVTALENVFHTYGNTWEEALSLNDNPLLGFTKSQMQVMEHLYQIVLLEKGMTDNKYYKPMIRSLSQTILYMLSDIIGRSSNNGFTGISVREQHFKHFVQLLWASHGKERTVSFYADKMCITTKYLSVIVRECSGKTPMQMIHSYASNIIAQMLTNSDMSIQEIAIELNFSSETFFGKYVKKHLGCSPRKYREKVRKK